MHFYTYSIAILAAVLSFTSCSKWTSRQATLGVVFQQLGDQVDQTLLELRPELTEKMEAIEDFKEDCYNAKFGKRKVDIFKEKIGTIIMKYFKENGKVLDGLDVPKTRQRVTIFIDNLVNLVNLIASCAERKAQGLPVSRLGLTSMTVYSDHEFKNRILNSKLAQAQGNLQLSEHPDCLSEIKNPNEKEAALPKRFSWREKDRVSPVYSQGACGSCYVFSAISAIDSQYMIRKKTNKHLQLSPQEILNCMPGSCRGGNLEGPMDFAAEKHGVTLEANLPYTSGDTNTTGECKTNFPAALKVDHVCSYRNLNQTEIRRFILRNGPHAVAIDTHSKKLQNLNDETYNYECGTAVNHAVLLVGWTETHWIIKNSWDTTWGKDGYFHLPREENKCGIQLMLAVPIVTQVPDVPPTPMPTTPAPTAPTNEDESTGEID